MKRMKRLLAIVLGAALLCPMTAYAGQSEEAKALYDLLVLLYLLL